MNMKRTLCLLAGLGWLWLGNSAVRAGDGSGTNTARIGVFDSRAVAYACFVSESNQVRLKERMTEARTAKQAGDTNRFNELAAALRGTQDNMDREVFSSAPATEALAAMKERIPDIEKQAGVTALVSKWDEAGLKQYPQAEKVDVTDQLVREFIQPTDKQAKTIASIIKSEPLSPEKCEELIRKHQL
jgi:hypothetical protein